MMSDWKKKFPNNFIFETENGILYWGDSKKILKQFPNNSCDIIITDPPYQKAKEKLPFINDDGYGDENTIFQLEDEFWRILKKDGFLILYWSVKNLPKAFSFKKFQYVWQLVAVFPSSFSKCLLGDRKYFVILVFKKGDPKVVFKRTDVIYAEELPIIQNKLKKPDFKPTGVNARLIQMFAKKNDIILDPFSGWGSLLKVCEIFKRKWIGIELNKERVDTTIKFLTTDQI